MYLIYRMGVLNNISGALGFGTQVTTNTSRNNVKRMNNTQKNMAKNKTTVLVPQAGGVAPVNFRYPANMQQPSEEIMEWATTAGAPTPMNGMRNVAHGGKRRTNKKHHSRRHRKHKKHTRHVRK